MIVFLYYHMGHVYKSKHRRINRDFSVWGDISLDNQILNPYYPYLNMKTCTTISMVETNSHKAGNAIQTTYNKMQNLATGFFV